MHWCWAVFIWYKEEAYPLPCAIHHSILGKIYTIKPCAFENTDMSYENRNSYILSGLVAVKMLDNYQMEVVNSGLSLIPNKIIAYKTLQLICLP
jgi:hypothetical protein